MNLKSLFRPRRTDAPVGLPDPAKPPSRRGDWDQAAMTNVDVTEFVKRQIRTTTKPWQK